MTFLIIGGAGYIGSHFIRHCLDQNHQCVAYDNLSTGHSHAVDKRCPLIEGDLLDADKLRETIKEHKVSAIFHFAAKALVGESVDHPSLYYVNNVEGVRTLLELLRTEFKELPLVFSSTCAVMGIPKSLPIKESDEKNPISPYGKTKLVAEFLIEDYARAYGLRGISLRYFNACGAHSSGDIGEAHEPETHLIPNIIKKALKGETLQVFGQNFDTPDGTCVRDYIHVTDLAIAHLKAVEKLFKEKAGFYDVMQLGTGKGYSNLEIIKATEKVMQQEIDYEMSEPRPGDPASLYASIEKAQSYLDFEPKHSSLENILGTALRWHKSQES